VVSSFLSVYFVPFHFCQTGQEQIYQIFEHFIFICFIQTLHILNELVMDVLGTEEDVQHKQLARVDAHKRIIWACSWSPCSRFFATGSRDRTVKIWEVLETCEGNFQVRLITALPPFKCSVTAVAWAPFTTLHMLAIGKEDGSLELWRGNYQQETRKLDMSYCSKVDTFSCHAATIHRLCWRALPTPSTQKETELKSSRLELQTLQLASCGSDHTVRIYNVHIR